VRDWQDRGWGFAAGTIKQHPSVSPKNSCKGLIRAGHHLGWWLQRLWRFMWSPQGTGSHSIMVVPWVCFPQQFAQRVRKCLPNPSEHSAKPCSSSGWDSHGFVITRGL